MMIYDPYEYETVVEHTTCYFHQHNPGVAFPGCTCSGSYSLRKTGRLLGPPRAWPLSHPRSDSVPPREMCEGDL